MCSPSIERKKDLPARVTQTLFLKHYYTHTDSIHVFTDGSKSDVGLGYGVIFPFFSRGGNLPPVASVVTAAVCYSSCFINYFYSQFPLLSFLAIRVVLFQH